MAQGSTQYIPRGPANHACNRNLSDEDYKSSLHSILNLPFVWILVFTTGDVLPFVLKASP